MTTIVRLVFSLLLILVATTSTSLVNAQDYPSRPVRLLVASAAGGVVDVLARLLAENLGPRLGQSVIVENRAGGATQLGTEAVARATPDGYTLLIGTSEMPMLPFIKKSYPYEPLRDFTQITPIANSWTVFAVHPSVPANTLPEFVSYAKARPGQLRYGHSGVGSLLHIAVEMLKVKSGIDLVAIPYRGGAQSVTDAISGQIEMTSIGLATARAAEGGKLRLLAQTGPVRHPLFPQVQTTAEAGYPDVRGDTWFALTGPAGMADDVVARLNQAVREVSLDPAYHQKLSLIGAAPFWMSVADFRAYIAQESRKWQQLIPEMGIPVVE